MFNFFKKKSDKEILLKKYNSLIEEAYNLSKINRKSSDEKTAEANELLEKIEKMID